MRIAVVTAASGGAAGAENLYAGLLAALRELTSHQVDHVPVPVDESSYDAILASYLRCYDLDLAAYDLVISTKAPTYAIRHPNHVSYLVHTIRVFYDMFAVEYGGGTAEQRKQRRIIQHLDTQALQPPRTRRHCAIGRTPFERLVKIDPSFRSVPLTVLPPPSTLGGYRAPQPGEHALVPGRLHRWKRVDLLIRAYRELAHDLPLEIVGRGEDEAALRALAKGDPRIRFRGHVPDGELAELYARALVVPFVPMNEDYGLITYEAFRAGKPVLTCTDSGEPLRFVRDGETGLVCPPEPRAIAAALARLVEEPGLAAEMGERGGAAIADVTWERVVGGLLGSLRNPVVREVARPARLGRTCRVLVTDDQCIEPATGGGRLRLLGLYGSLGDGVTADYLGTFGWPGQERRELPLTPTLREVDVPLSPAHFELAGALGRIQPGLEVFDATLAWLVPSSPAFVDELRRRVDEADVVVVSHPWLYPALRAAARQAGKPVVYDAHNCEGLLRAELLGGTPWGDCLAAAVRFVEGLLCEESVAILACSDEDRRSFAGLYGVAPDKIHLAPNGTFTERIRPAAPEERAAARRALGVGGTVALFIGSAYAPNDEAARLIAGELAPALPEVTFLLAGGAGDAVAGALACPRNVVRLGALSEADLGRALAAADLGLNPMLRGSGVNIKMLDYWAAGLAVVTTAVGARGLELPDDGGAAAVVAAPDDFAAAIRALAADGPRRERMAAAARRLAEERYDWRRISAALGERLRGLAGGSPAAAVPDISVIVPTYGRPALLRRLLERLDEQTWRDFEVIVVDQTPGAAEPTGLRVGYPLRYVCTTDRGAARARNFGAARARGRIVAFTDDDCAPDPTWLERARGHFADAAVAGVEGRIASDQTDRQRYRVVTNDGSGGGLYMTANLFLRRDVMMAIAGFDERFDAPHFREDTDLGWRALAWGQIVFAPEVSVLHPAQERAGDERESEAERMKGLVHDPLLFCKHPERYVRLMRHEGHHARAEFWRYFDEGIARHDLPITRATLLDAMAAAADLTPGGEAADTRPREPGSPPRAPGA